MGFISKFILPKQVDFDAALQAQTHTTRMIVENLYKASADDDETALAAIAVCADQARSLKSSNMKELLDVFITPYDKESIFRIITQLDWVALSVNHFRLETQAYGVTDISEYRPQLEEVVAMARLLEQGVTHLSSKDLMPLTRDIELIHDKYDHVVALCAGSLARLLAQNDCKHIIIHRDILAQLKEVAKRIHITANTLEDMAIKLV